MNKLNNIDKLKARKKIERTRKCYNLPCDIASMASDKAYKMNMNESLFIAEAIKKYKVR